MNDCPHGYDHPLVLSSLLPSPSLRCYSHYVSMYLTMYLCIHLCIHVSNYVCIHVSMYLSISFRTFRWNCILLSSAAYAPSLNASHSHYRLYQHRRHRDWSPTSIVKHVKTELKKLPESSTDISRKWMLPTPTQIVTVTLKCTLTLTQTRSEKTCVGKMQCIFQN